MSSVQMVKSAETPGVLGYIDETDSIQPKKPRKPSTSPCCWTEAASCRGLVSPGVSHTTSYTILTHTQESKGTHPSGSVVSWWFTTHGPRNVGMCLSVRVFESLLRNDDVTVPSVIKSPNASCLLCSFVVWWDRVVTVLLWYADLSPELLAHHHCCGCLPAPESD